MFVPRRVRRRYVITESSGAVEPGPWFKTGFATAPDSVPWESCAGYTSGPSGSGAGRHVITAGPERLEAMLRRVQSLVFDLHTAVGDDVNPRVLGTGLGVGIRDAQLEPEHLHVLALEHLIDDV